MSVSSTSSKQYDVVVVGAGLAGLQAAVNLHKQGHSVVVLEARDRVGGRVYSVDHEGHVIDMGAQFVGDKQTRVLALAKELSVNVKEVPTKGKCVLRTSKGRHLYAEGTRPSLSLPALLDLGHAIQDIDSNCPAIPKDKPWFNISADALDSVTVEAWKNKTLWTEEAGDIVDITTRAVLGAEASEVSQLSLLWYSHSGHNLTYLTETSQGAQKYMVEGGSQQLAQGLAEKLPGNSVLLNAAVARIEQDEADETVVVTCTNGTVVTGRRLVMAMSPTVARSIEFDPQLPGDRLHLQDRTPMGAIIKTISFYASPWWRQRGLNGIAADVEGPVSSTFDDSGLTDDGQESYALLGFIGGADARNLSKLSMEERGKLVAEQYATLFGCEEARSPVDYVDMDWMAEPYSRGAYSSLFAPGVLTQVGGALREPVGLVHFAGTETATDFAGYMEGALDSGERVAKEVDALLCGNDMPDPVMEMLKADNPTVAITPSPFFNAVDTLALFVFYAFACYLIYLFYNDGLFDFLSWTNKTLDDLGL